MAETTQDRLSINAANGIDCLDIENIQASDASPRPDVAEVINAINQRREAVRSFNDKRELGNDGRLYRNAFTKLAIKKLGLIDKYPTLSAYNVSSTPLDRQSVSELIHQYGNKLRTCDDITRDKSALLDVAQIYISASEKIGEPTSIQDALAVLRQIHLSTEGGGASTRASISKIIYERSVGMLLFDREKSPFNINIENTDFLNDMSDMLLDGETKDRLKKLISTQPTRRI